MSSYPPCSRADHNTFCVNEEWVLVRDAKGNPVQHHRTYELELADARILRTRISRPVDKTQYGSTMWATILRDQLCVNREEFWLCVREGVLPDRPERNAARLPESEPKPAGLVDKLRRLVGLSDEEIARLTKDEAAARLNQYWAENS